MFCNGLITNNIDTESTATTSSAIELMFTEEIDYKSKHLQQSTIQQCMQAVEQEEAEVNHHSLRNDNLKPMQDEFFKQLRDLLKSGRLYDKVFAAVLVFELPLGVLSQPSLQHMCNTCHKHLHPPQPSAMSKKPPTPPNLPPNSLINGRFKGTVPTYLSKLTTIEMSMIALRSSIVKIIVAGGKYHAALGEMFTIINDVVQVNVDLPCMTSPLSTAILRHESWSSGLKREFTFSPYRVRVAINMLRLINPSWEHVPFVPIQWATDQTTDAEERIHPPHYSISDEEEKDLMESHCRPADSAPSTNTGNALRTKWNAI